MEPTISNHIAYGLSLLFPCEIYFYDLKTQICKCKTLPLSKTYKGKVYDPRFPAACAMSGNNCIISGGGHPEFPDFFKTTLMCSINPIGEWTFNIKPVQEMLMAKAEHSIIALTDDIFLSVGGISPKSLLNYCEAYYISKDLWVQQNPLSTPRKQTSLCVFSGAAVYAFGGNTAKDLPIDSIEKLKLGDPKNTWRNVFLAGGASFFPLSSSLIAQIDEETILIAGGSTYELGSELDKSGGKTLVPLIETKKSWLFNPKNNKIIPGPELTYPAAFSLGPAMISKDCICGIDIQMSLHVYSKDGKHWECIRQAKWNSFKYQLKAGSEMGTFLK